MRQAVAGLSVDAFEPETPIGAAVAAATRLFAAAGLDTPELDARILILDAAGATRHDLLLEPQRALGAAACRVRGFVGRRLAREPVARILGAWEFWGLEFELAPSTLVPRPATETLVEAALAEADRQGARDRHLRILDLGTGSGAILVALLSELPAALGIGVDRDEGAAAVARRNARRHGLAQRAAFLTGDWASAIEAQFDLLVANPPYVERAVIARLSPEVRDHDPGLALDGGADGLDAYRVIVAAANRLVTPHGCMLLECGAGQAAPVGALLEAAHRPNHAVRRDLDGIERVVLSWPVVHDTEAASVPGA